MVLKKRYILTLFTVLLVSIVFSLYMSSYNSFMDILNEGIKRNSEFKPFYAGIEGLPSSNEYIPEIKEIEDNWKEVRKEMENIYSEDIPTMQEAYNNMFLYKGSGTDKKSKFSGLQKILAKLIYGDDIDTFDKIASDKWRTYNLILFNQDVDNNALKCPKTISFLKKIPGMQSALFSIMKPGTYIPPHSDPSKGVVRYHLALKVPKDRENCFINVNDKNYHWEEGKGVIFDESYQHWVRNDTDETRVILFVDILRPLTGWGKTLQGFANLINFYNPGVKRLIKESKVKTKIESIKTDLDTGIKT